MTRTFGTSAVVVCLFCATATALAQNPVTISSTKLQSNFNGAIGAGQSAPIAASAFDFSGQPTLHTIQSASITVTVIDGDTGFGSNGISDTPYPPDGGVYGDDDFDVNSLGLRLDGVDLGQNLLLNTLTSYEEPFGPEDYITRTITGSPANKTALLSALQDGLLVATIHDSTGISQSNGLRIPGTNFTGTQQIFVTLSITGLTDSTLPVVSFIAPVAGQVISGVNAQFSASASDSVGILRVEFFVDGIPRYTDVNSGNQTQFHFGGAPAGFDTTQYTNGAHTLRIRAVDSDGQTAEEEIQITIGNGCDAWMAQYFAPNDPNGNGAADPDGDGLTNLLEYASDSNPLLPKVDRLPIPRIVEREEDGVEFLALQFVIVKWATDLVYRVEASSTLPGSWTQIDPAAPATLVSVQDDLPAFGLKTVIVRDLVPKSGNRRFMRLRVTKP